MAARFLLCLCVPTEDIPCDFCRAHHAEPRGRSIEDVECEVVGTVDERVCREGPELAEGDGGVGDDLDGAGCAGGETDEDVRVGEDALSDGGRGGCHRCLERGVSRAVVRIVGNSLLRMPRVAPVSPARERSGDVVGGRGDSLVIPSAPNGCIINRNREWECDVCYQPGMHADMHSIVIRLGGGG